MASIAAWTAGGVAALGAKIAYAYVEGVTFAFSRPVALLIAAAELTAFAWTAGVRLPLRVAAGTMVAAGTLRGLQRLVMSLHHSGEPKGSAAGEALASIWDWEPPGGDGSQSSAWHILRQLGVTARKVQAENPGIARLLSQPSLAPNELAMRLYNYYRTSDQRPMLDPADMAAASPSGGSGSGNNAGKEEAEAEGQGGGVDAVPQELMEQVAYYRAMTCLPYDFDTDAALAEQLAKLGFILSCASHTADIASGCPAYLLAVSEEREEVVLVIRGTFSIEDAFFDLLATGEAFDEHTEEEEGCQPLVASHDAAQKQVQEAHRLSGHCHSGMGRAALYLGAKFGPLLRPLYAQGMRVTLVGHSLGAGVASLLAVFLRNRGLGAERLRCWAYETPACMDLEMAQACSDVVTSLVHADDLVPRLTIRSFAGLLQELADFDWRAAQAAEDGGEGKGSSVVAQQLSSLLGWALGSSSDGERKGEDGSKDGKQEATQEQGKEKPDSTDDAAAEAEGGASGACDPAFQGSDGFEADYNPHVPGRVMLLVRQPGNKDKGSGDGDGGRSDDGSVDGGSESESLMEEKPSEHCVAVLLPCTHPAVRRMRVSSRMISDHFVDSQEVIAALGG